MLPLIVIPVAVVAVLAFARKKKPAQTTLAAGAAPSPLAALAIYQQTGGMPPPIVIQCAIAEAQAAGRHDIVSEIVRAYVEPVVRARNASTSPPAPAPAAPVAAVPAPTQVGVALAKREPPGALVAIRSPIKDASDRDWQAFVDALERADVDFQNGRQIGAFRHRIDRLTDLGLEPHRLLGDRQAQIEALGVDMADALNHAKAGGVVEEFVATTVDVGGVEHVVTLSGILGVTQAAGLEGCYEWLVKPSDRERFPHTTKQFLATNGVF